MYPELGMLASLLITQATKLNNIMIVLYLLQQITTTIVTMIIGITLPTEIPMTIPRGKPDEKRMITSLIKRFDQ